MLHAVKMKLVPAHSATADTISMPPPPPPPPRPQPPVAPVVRQLSDLDQQMSDILQHTDKGLEEKINAYQHVLQRYQKFYAQYHGTTQHTPPTSAPTTTTTPNHHPAPNIEDIEKEVVQSLPKNLRAKGQRLMMHLKNNGVMTYNDRGQLIHHGMLVPGTHILDLVNDALRPSHTKPPPQGRHLFVDGLKESNTPQQYVASKYFKTFEAMKEKRAASPSPASKIKAFKRIPRRRTRQSSPDGWEEWDA